MSRLASPLSLAPLGSRLPILLKILFSSAVVALGWVGLVAFYDAEDGRILAGWSYDVHQRVNAGDERGNLLEGRQGRPTRAFSERERDPGQTNFGALALLLELPELPLVEGEFVSARKSVCTEEDRTLAFYVSTPYKRLEVSGVFELQVWRGESRLWTLELPAADLPTYHEIPWDGHHECRTLEFRLVSHVTNAAPSWQRASRVEIIFPRLQDDS